MEPGRDAAPVRPAQRACPRDQAQLAILSEKAGVPYESPADGVPDDVVELARSGKQLEAVTRYRELTGADIDEAREVVGRL